jgi:regulator of nucleoside diphosphate kinase
MKERLVTLCPEITRDHALLMVDWLKEEDVRRYLSDTQNVSDDIVTVVNRVNLPVLTHIFNQKGRFYIVCDKQNVPVGFVRLVKKSDGYEIVVVIGDRHKWNKKLGTSAILESIKTAFFEFRAQKVIAKIYKENVRSIKAFMNAGFRLESQAANLGTYTITMTQFLQRMKGAPAGPSEIYITDIDHERIKRILDKVSRNAQASEAAVKRLEAELFRTHVVESTKIPEDIVTMNSKVLLQLDGEDIEVSLVYPEDADHTGRKLSILSPIGTAIIGYREGCVFDWELPDGMSKIHIKKVLYQPEAAGDYHL